MAKTFTHCSDGAWFGLRAFCGSKKGNVLVDTFDGRITCEECAWFAPRLEAIQNHTLTKLEAIGRELAAL